MSADTRIRVVLADDHPLYRRGVSALLAAQQGVDPPDRCGQPALTAARSARPSAAPVEG